MENPYAPPVTDPMVAQTEDQPQVLAGFGIRFVALTADVVWMLALNYALGFAIYGGQYFDDDSWWMGWKDVVISDILPLLITVWFWKHKGATPGQIVCGIRIVSVDGSPLSVGQCVGRYLGTYVSAAGLGLGFLWAAWDPQNQTWHDKMARTLVVKNP